MTQLRWLYIPSFFNQLLFSHCSASDKKEETHMKLNRKHFDGEMINRWHKQLMTVRQSTCTCSDSINCIARDTNMTHRNECFSFLFIFSLFYKTKKMYIQWMLTVEIWRKKGIQRSWSWKRSAVIPRVLFGKAQLIRVNLIMNIPSLSVDLLTVWPFFSGGRFVVRFDRQIYQRIDNNGTIIIWSVPTN